MARPKGAKNRDNEKDSVRYLRRWLKKVRTGREARGCALCGGQGTLVFWHPDPEVREFSISAGPGIRGMTLERLKAEVAKTETVCRECLRGSMSLRVNNSKNLRLRESLCNGGGGADGCASGADETPLNLDDVMCESCKWKAKRTGEFLNPQLPEGVNPKYIIINNNVYMRVEGADLEPLDSGGP